MLQLQKGISEYNDAGVAEEYSSVVKALYNQENLKKEVEESKESKESKDPREERKCRREASLEVGCLGQKGALWDHVEAKGFRKWQKSKGSHRKYWIGDNWWPVSQTAGRDQIIKTLRRVCAALVS